MSKSFNHTNDYKLLIEKRAKYKYYIIDVRQVIKLLCTNDSTIQKNEDYLDIFGKLEGRISIRHIKTINYILRYGEIRRIEMMLKTDYNNPYKIRYMIGRIKNIVKKFDRDEKHETYESIIQKLGIGD